VRGAGSDVHQRKCALKAIKDFSLALMTIAYPGHDEAADANKEEEQ